MKKDNIYKVTYKNGNVRVTEAYSMELKDGKLYQARRHYPFDNIIWSVIDGTCIVSVELIEKNNDLENWEV